jgi:hypothetical protein
MGAAGRRRGLRVEPPKASSFRPLILTRTRKGLSERQAESAGGAPQDPAELAVEREGCSQPTRRAPACVPSPSLSCGDGRMLADDARCHLPHWVSVRPLALPKRLGSVGISWLAAGATFYSRTPICPWQRCRTRPVANRRPFVLWAEGPPERSCLGAPPAAPAGPRLDGCHPVCRRLGGRNSRPPREEHPLVTTRAGGSGLGVSTLWRPVSAAHLRPALSLEAPKDDRLRGNQPGSGRSPPAVRHTEAAP